MGLVRIWHKSLLRIVGAVGCAVKRLIVDEELAKANAAPPVHAHSRTTWPSVIAAYKASSNCRHQQTSCLSRLVCFSYVVRARTPGVRVQYRYCRGYPSQTATFGGVYRPHPRAHLCIDVHGVRVRRAAGSGVGRRSSCRAAVLQPRAPSSCTVARRVGHHVTIAQRHTGC